MRVLAVLLLLTASALGQDRPNIIWINAEDQSAHYGPFIESAAQTPNVNRLASEGVKFSRAFVTAPVCSPSRSALITGMYQTTIGAHQHRSSRSEKAIHLPADVRTIPELLRASGYYVTNGGLRDPQAPLAKGKTDYNFVYADNLYDGADWRDRPDGKPFFSQIHLRGGKFRNQRTLAKTKGVKTRGIDPAAVELPPYYPDDPDLRLDWAQYLESVEQVDWEVGQILARLEREGVSDNTVVFFFTDHGVSHARGKQFLYEEGIRIPLIVWGAGIEKGKAREDLVAHIDIAAETLRIAGVEPPKSLQGRPLFGPGSASREYVISARDRCDETVDRIRSVRTLRYKYIRNYYPGRPHMQPNRYKDAKAVVRTLRRLHLEGKLSLEQDRIFNPTRPAEELYDLDRDPYELRNLAADPRHSMELSRHRAILERWIEQSGDRGRTPEPDDFYDAEMELYLSGRNADDPDNKILKGNIAQMKKWAAEGK
jgi:arylsulfatase A-like enzyme